MFIKRFEAPTLLQAVEHVRTELGSNAVILSTRSVRSKALFPWLKKPLYEVIAAKYDEEGKADMLDGQGAATAGQVPPKGVELRPDLDIMIDDDGERKFAAYRNASISKSGLQGVQDTKPRTAANPQFDGSHVQPQPNPVPTIGREIQAYLQPIIDDIARIKEQIATIASPLAEPKEFRGQAAELVRPPVIQPEPRVEVIPDYEGITSLEEYLYVSGLGMDNVERIVGGVRSIASTTDMQSSDRIYGKAREVVRNILAESREWGDIQSGGPRRIALIGPTGVGKTTTLAKLAARYVLMQNKTLSLVAADTYRVAAVSQLKMYGELLGVEVDVVHNPGEMRTVVEARGNKDIILIDTAGRSQRNGGSLETLKELLDAASPTEIHLVLSVTTKLSDLMDVVNRFAPLKFDRLLFTKLDESDNYGDLVDVVLKTNQSVSFLTTGQSVPNDIEVATADRVMSLLLPDPGTIRG